MRWLDAHDGAAPAVTPADARAVWLTGQSAWTHSLLSPAQHAVLDELAAHGWAPLRVGFPWTQRAGTGTYRAEPLLTASVRNTRQWAAARPGSGFARQAARHLQALLDHTRTDLLLLCGSAGAQLVSVAAPLVTPPPGLRVHVVGLGPVGTLPPSSGAWSVHAVRGADDRISRWGYRGPVDVVVPGGHLDTATSPAARDAVLRLVGPPTPPDRLSGTRPPTPRKVRT